MQRDLGSRDTEFIDLVARIRTELLEIAGVSQESGYEAVLMQGSGTFALEAVLSSVIPPDGRLLVLANGAYGERMLQIAERLKIAAAIQRWPEDESPDPETVRQLLAAEPPPTHVAIVHLETTTGILNPLEEIARIVHEHGCRFIVDAMSSFGGVPIDLSALQPDYLVSSANKCLEGVPGFSYVLARREALESTAGYARSVSLDLLAQWQGFERNGQFRFTPPTHALLAFAQALEEFGRGRRRGGDGPSVTAQIATRFSPGCAGLASASISRRSGRATSSPPFAIPRILRSISRSSIDGSPLKGWSFIPGKSATPIASASAPSARSFPSKSRLSSRESRECLARWGSRCRHRPESP